MGLYSLSNNPFLICNLGSSEELKVHELVDFFCHRDPMLRIQQTEARFVETMSLRIDCTQTEKDLGWKHRLSKDEMLEWVWEEYMCIARQGDIRSLMVERFRCLYY